MRARSALYAGLALTLLATPAAAEGLSGWYLGLGAGYSQLGHIKWKHNGVPGVFSAGTDDMAIGAATFGYRFDDGLRLEAEIAYDPHKLNDATFTFGHAEFWSAMANIAYDFHLDERWTLSIGGGVGAGRGDVHTHAGPFDYVVGRHTGLMWQGLFDVGYAVSPELELLLGYRYRSWSSDDLYGTSFVTFPPHVLETHEHVAMFTIRWYFDQPAAPVIAPPPPAPELPPPPAPLPPPPVKTFIVFFDFDRSDLTDKAMEVVSAAVRAAKATGTVRVLVTGHTDTVGSDGYNMALSLRRARSVKDEMMSQGIPGDGIEIAGKGYHDPLVPTGPGVREPQNRRAVIDFGG